jgi:hypothetical protein
MSGPTLAACDLDRTLVYSRRSAAVPPEPAGRLVCVEHHLGREQSFVSRGALAGLREVAARLAFVPATTRTTAQARRVRFPGLPALRHQIVANGGVLLVDGLPDLDWAGEVRRRIADSAVPLEEVRGYLSGRHDEPWLQRLHVAEDLFCYALVEREALPAGVLEEIQDWTAHRGWVTSLQGRKLYAVPRSLDKATAVQEVARRIGAARVVAAGDSLLDRAMLAEADAGIRPGHGELATQGWSVPHVVTLAETGVAAGERIVDWLLTQDGGDEVPRQGPAVSVA